MCTSFQTKRTTLNFWFQNLPKNRFWGRNFKYLSLDSEPTPPIFHVDQFSVKVGKFWFFVLNLGKLHAIFWFKYCWGCCRELGGGWNEVDGAGWSWVEVDGAEWSLVHGLVIHNKQYIWEKIRNVSLGRFN